ncbi:MAG: hypothetical protein GY702_14330 [Desulfobulbaceae bacterium]|nr:hypothetical protein [Desulfobulbaceae bacterium]
MPRIFCAVVFVAVSCLLAGCGDKDPEAYSGQSYPPTNKIVTAFQYTQVPGPCRVFAELLVEIPANLSGKEIQQIIYTEAGNKGADLVLIGQSRQRDDDNETNFIYFGPKAEYLCSTNWCGWKFGFDEWEDQGEWVDIGMSEWGNQNIRIEPPLLMQVAFMRCR